jgi:anaerobic selenocysteine-containing dehydrogenase
MRRREFLKYSAATALAGSVGYRAAMADAPTVKVGVVGAKTGPLAALFGPRTKVCGS